MLENNVFEAENTLGPLLDRVEQGEEIVITRHGEPVARLVPTETPLKVDRAQVRAAMERIDRLPGKLKGPFNWEQFKLDRDAGRK